jgi:hypothetical protein
MKFPHISKGPTSFSRGSSFQAKLISGAIAENPFSYYQTSSASAVDHHHQEARNIS